MVCQFGEFNSFFCLLVALSRIPESVEFKLKFVWDFSNCCFVQVPCVSGLVCLKT